MVRPGPGKITLDQESFKALASEVRVGILKTLDERRQTVTDLSNLIGLSKPTLLEHLEKLQAAGLVKRMDEGRKWIYYELTRRGRNILRPHQVKIMISLALSVLLFSASLVAILTAATTPVTFSGGTGSTGGTATTDGAFERFLGGQETFPDAMAAGAPGPWGVIVAILAVIPLLLALWYWRAGRGLINAARLQLAT